MDTLKSASNIVKLIYAKRQGRPVDAELVKLVCEFFDSRKNDILSENDLFFLRHIGSEAGIPQYYSMLSNFQNGLAARELDYHLDAIPTFIIECNLLSAEGVQLHEFQKEVLSQYINNARNRYFLSASTSFGKTYLTYEIIRKMQYNNVCLIFPTIALLSENIQKIYLDPTYHWIKDTYKIHTLSDTELHERKNLFIFTPERYLSFIDKHDSFSLDFLFVDEVYKIDNDFLQDDEQRENERDVAYRISTHIGLNQSCDCLLAGPYIKIDPTNNNSSIMRFLNWASIRLLDYNHLNIVGKQIYNLKNSRRLSVTDFQEEIRFSTSGKIQRFKELVCELINKDENVIIYCPSKAKAESYARELIHDLPDIDTTSFIDFLSHLNSLFKHGKGAQWVVTKGLSKGVGVHHGLVPKYIQNEIIHLFNRQIIKILFVTTTITEGVNTSAKNIIILSHLKGRKQLKTFDAKNIEGRAGRFIHHYVGRVFILDNDFSEIANNDDEVLKHKFFDTTIPKQSVDYPYVRPEYLSEEESNDKRRIEELILSSQIPESVINSFKTVSPEDKSHLYESIKRLTSAERVCIQQMITAFARRGVLKKDGFEIICNKIKAIAKSNNEIVALIELRRGTSPYCTLTNMVAVFLLNGFVGEVDYYALSEDIDSAVRKSAQFIFNTLRYQVVKYVGLFNLCYKNVLAQEQDCSVDMIQGLDALLMKMEYNANTKLGRKASDAGACFNVINYYDQLSNNPNTNAYNDLDEFEKYNADRIREIVLQ